MDKDGYHGYDKIERPCPNCEYHKQQAQRWRDEAYKQAGHPLPEREWVELTMDDFTDILKLASEGRPLEVWELFKAVETKAREKNT